MRAVIDFGHLGTETRHYRRIYLTRKVVLAHAGYATGSRAWQKLRNACMVAHADYDAAKLKEQCAYNRAWRHKS